MKKYNRGFTLIELLVVIAIIGILASVVLVSLGSARNKGNDAKVQEQMSSMRAAAEIYYSNNNNSYASMASVVQGDDSGLYNLLQGDNYYNTTAPTVVVATDGQQWLAHHALSNGFICVDSSGASKTYVTATEPTWPAADSTVICPAN